MTTLTSSIRDALEIYINHKTGESFASVKGYARFSTLSEQTISERVLGLSQTTTKEIPKVFTAELLTADGLQVVNLIDEDLVAEWLPEDNPSLAAQLMKQGIRPFIHKMAGYTHQEPRPMIELTTRCVAAIRAIEEEKPILVTTNKELAATKAVLVKLIFLTL